MPTIAEKIVIGRLDRQADELETSLRASGEIFESLPLGLGDTLVEREVMPDGSKGRIRICTAEGIVDVTSNRYLLQDGQIITDPAYGVKPERVISFRKFKILARIALGRPDHWNHESDFDGTVIDLGD